MITSSQIIAAARDWIGTPYQHQASCLEAGVDCLGLVRGVYRSLYGAEPAVPPPYARFAEPHEGEILWDAARTYLIELKPPLTPQPGQVLLFRIRRGLVARHLGIVSGDHKMIHAANESAVCEVSLTSWWLSRHVASFKFPDTEPIDAQEESNKS